MTLWRTMPASSSTATTRNTAARCTPRVPRRRPRAGPSSRRNFRPARRLAPPGGQGAPDRHQRHAGRLNPVKRVDQHDQWPPAWRPGCRSSTTSWSELASRCPAEYKLAQDGKGILKEAARQVIPHEVIDRPKGYFPVPGAEISPGPVTWRWSATAVTSKAARGKKNGNLFDPGYVDMLLDDPEAHITPLRGSKAVADRSARDVAADPRCINGSPGGETDIMTATQESAFGKIIFGTGCSV